jgi:hypothetical protein
MWLRSNVSSADLHFAFPQPADKHTRMTHLLRPYIAFMLALTLALASVGHAQARNQAHGANTMVICTGYGLVRITMDVDGNPVEQTLPCPDCILSYAALPGTMPTIAALLVTSRHTSFLELPLRHFGAAGMWHRSRAPPVLV